MVGGGAGAGGLELPREVVQNGSWALFATVTGDAARRQMGEKRTPVVLHLLHHLALTSLVDAVRRDVIADGNVAAGCVGGRVGREVVRLVVAVDQHLDSVNADQLVAVLRQRGKGSLNETLQFGRRATRVEIEIHSPFVDVEVLQMSKQQYNHFVHPSTLRHVTNQLLNQRRYGFLVLYGNQIEHGPLYHLVLPEIVLHKLVVLHELRIGIRQEFVVCKHREEVVDQQLLRITHARPKRPPPHL